ncbi:MAG: DUF805 domain-containing protein [Paracoccaceae bacterium]
MILPYRRYADFAGRSGRREYWMFFLLMGIVGAVLGGALAVGIGEDDGSGTLNSLALTRVAMILTAIWGLGSIVRFVAVHVRRFHDQDRSGWWVLLGALLGVNLIVLIFMGREGTRGANRFGADPGETGRDPA